jgi:hypothetical protein
MLQLLWAFMNHLTQRGCWLGAMMGACHVGFLVFVCMLLTCLPLTAPCLHAALHLRWALWQRYGAAVLL